MPVASLPLNSISTHPDLQMRADGSLDQEHLGDLVAFLKEQGNDLPRIKVAKVFSQAYVVDGHYRLEAYRTCKRSHIPAEVITCSWLDAISMAATANSEHNAKRRTREDKHRAVITLINTLFTLNANWSNRKIADVARVSEGFVRKIVDEYTPVKIAVPQGETPKTVQPRSPAQTAIPAKPLVEPKQTVADNHVRIYAPEPSFDNERYPDDDDEQDQPMPAPDKVLGRDGKEYNVPVSDNASTVKQVDFQKLESSLGSLARLLDDANKVRPKPLLLASAKRSLDNVLSLINQWKKE